MNLKRKKQQKHKILSLTFLAMFFTLASLFTSNFGVNNSLVGDNTPDDIQNDEPADIQNPESSALDSQSMAGVNIGLHGLTQGTMDGSVIFGNWAWDSEVGFYTSRVGNPYVIPFPESTGGTSIVPSWDYKRSDINVWNLREENDFLSGSDFNGGGWTNGPAVDEATAGQQALGPGGTSWGDFANENVGYIDFDNNQRTLTPTLITNGWSQSTTLTEPTTRSSRGRMRSDSYGDDYAPLSHTDTDQNTGSPTTAIHSSTYINAWTNTDTTQARVNTRCHLYWDVIARDDSQHEHDDWCQSYLSVDSSITSTANFEDRFSYTYDGTVPESATFQADIYSYNNINTGGTWTDHAGARTLYAIIYLESPSGDATHTLWETSTFGNYALPNEATSAGLEDLFDESGDYKVKIRVVTTLDMNSYGYVHGASGNQACTYAGNVQLRYDLRFSDIRLTINEEQPYNPTGYCYVQKTLDFGGRHVDATFDPYLEFDYSIEDELIQNEAAFGNSAVRAYVGYDYDGGAIDDWEYTDYSLTSNKHPNPPPKMTLTKSKLNLTETVYVRLGVSIGSGFEIDWNSEDPLWSRVFFANAAFVARSKPLPTDVGLNFMWRQTTGYIDSQAFTGSTHGSGSMTLLEGDTNGDLENWKLSGLSLYFSSTSEKLEFNFEHIIYATFDNWTAITTITVVNGSTTVDYDVQFDWNVPHNKILDGGKLRTGYDFSDGFNFNLTVPKYSDQGEPYWDLDQATVDPTGWPVITAFATETEPWDTGSDIYVRENTTYLTEANTQVVSVDNNLFDSPFLLDGYGQDWTFNFTAPNLITDLTIDDDDNFGSPSNLLYVGNYTNIKLDYSSSVSEGDVGANWVNNSEQLEHTESKAATGTTAEFTQTGGDAWNTIGEDVGGFYAIGNFSADHSDYDLHVLMSGVVRYGYMYKPFSLVKDTILNLIELSPAIYDTKTHGANGDLINITVRYVEKDNPSVGIPGANAIIDISQFEMGGGENKQPVVPAEWWQKSMVDMGDGYYTMYADPTFFGHTGNITWGFHNFTINVEKAAYLDKSVSENFTIIVDSELTISNPPKSQQAGPDQDYHPHFKTAIMGGNDTGLPEYLTTFTAYYKENLSESITHFVNVPGNPYNGMVEVNYTCLNYTRGDLTWWNWTWNEDKFSTTNLGNPINGSFTSPGDVWSATIFLPTKGSDYFKNIVDYESGIYLEYNITARVSTNMTYPPTSGIGTDFQPNTVIGQDCEDGYAVGRGDYDTVRAETILLQLIDPTEGNFTRVMVTDNQILDGNPFNRGTYDNDSIGATPYLTPTFIARNYYLNKSTGPHGEDSNKFRLRVLVNGSYAVRESAFLFSYPPCGPINGSKVTWYWEDRDTEIFNMTEDTTNLWNITMWDNSSGTPELKNLWGSTYYSDWINFSDRVARIDPYTIKIGAFTDGYMDSSAEVTVIIDKQSTEVNASDGTLLSTGDIPTQNIIDELPYGNDTTYTVSYNDVVNRDVPGEGLAPIVGALLNCTADNVHVDEENPFVKNQTTTGESTWRWQDEGNGDYSIFLNYTELSKNLDQYITITFELSKENYTSVIFRLQLNITKRRMEISLLSANNISVYSDSDNYDVFRFLTMEFHIVDLDDAGNPIIFDENELYNTFLFEYWNATTPNTKFDKSQNQYMILSSIPSGSPYNFTFDIKDIPVGDYSLSLNISKADSEYYWYTATFIATFRIIEAPLSLEITDYRNTTEYLPMGITNKDFTKSYQPYYQVKIVDINHSAILGSDYLIDFIGFTLDTNYSNPYYDTYSDDPNVHQDLRVYYTVTDGLIYVYIDAQRIPSDVSLIWLNLTFTRQYYVTTVLTVSLKIDNATTEIPNNEVRLDAMDGPITDKPNFPGLSALYQNTSHRTFAWNQTVGIRFEYIASLTGVHIMTDLAVEMITVTYSITDLDTNGTWGDFINNNAVFTDMLSGEHYLEFLLNTSTSGDVSLNFNLTINANNYESQVFPIRLTIRDRSTNYRNVTLVSAVKWTDDISFLVQYWDTDISMVPYTSAYIQDATVNGSLSFGVVDFGGETAVWNISRFGEGKYRLLINTENLSVYQVYTVDFVLAKAHYDSQLLTFQFSLTPIDISVNLTVTPNEEFEASEVETIFLHVSIMVHFQNDSGDQEYADLTWLEFTVSYVLEKDDEVIYSGVFYWDDVLGEFIANISTSKTDGEELVGIYELIITVDTNSTNINGRTATTKLLALGKGSDYIPEWFWVLLTVVIGAALGMAGYGVKKALYLRIPFVLRKIDETTKKIEKNKFPAVGVMTGRDEFIINSVINYLELCGIEWEREDKFEIKKVGEGAAKEKLPPLKNEEITKALESIGSLSREEILLFTDELNRLDRVAQDEFIASLRGDIGKGSKE